MDGNIYRSGDNAGNGGSGIMSGGLGIMLTDTVGRRTGSCGVLFHVLCII